MGQEIELKLVAGEGFDEGALVGRLQRLGAIGEAERFEQRDTYLDTERGELRAAGLSARVRERAGGRAVIVKVVPIDAGLVMRRTEIGADIEAGRDPSVVLVRMLERELGMRVAGRVTSILEIVTDRTVRMLRIEHQATIEVCVDRVRVLDGSQVEVGRFDEVEAELREGDDAVLERIASALQDATLQPSGQGKYPRARELVGLPAYDYGEAAPHFDSDTPRREVARAVCRHQLATMRAYEPGTRVGLDPEHLHKMRVASRRLRTALRVFGRELRKKDRKHLAEELKWIGARLGDVRDLDVHGMAIATWREQLGAEPKEGWERLAERLAAKRRIAQTRLVEALDDKRWPALCERATAAFAPSKRGGKPIWMVAPALLGRRVRSFAKGVDRFRSTHSAEDAHRLRILGKRLRYAAEFMKPLLSEDTRVQLERLAEFQDALGELQDTVQAGAFVKAQAADEPVPRPLQDVLARIARWADDTAADAGARVDAALDALQPDAFAAALERELGRTPNETEREPGASG